MKLGERIMHRIKGEGWHLVDNDGVRPNKSELTSLKESFERDNGLEELCLALTGLRELRAHGEIISKDFGTSKFLDRLDELLQHLCE